MNDRQGFTLVETLIVVVVLAIMATIVLPRITGATDRARAAHLTSNLRTGQMAIQLWHAEHQGQWPTLAQLQSGTDHWGAMLQVLSVDVEAAGKGPYLTEPLVNPLTESSRVIAEDDLGLTPAGWTYNEHTGALRAIVPAGVDVSDSGLGPNHIARLVEDGPNAYDGDDETDVSIRINPEAAR